jgi:hypothetical protein
MLITALLTAIAVAQTPPRSDPEPDSVVTTAPATAVILDGAEPPVAPAVSGAAQSTAPHGLNTDQQISQWLTARSSSPASHDDAPVWRDDRQPHGQVSVSLGTGGYRDYEAGLSLPIGESGRLDITIRQIENGYPYGYGHGAAWDPYFTDGGYAFPGRDFPGSVMGHERQRSRPEGTPDRRPVSYGRPAAE